MAHEIPAMVRPAILIFSGVAWLLRVINRAFVGETGHAPNRPSLRPHQLIWPSFRNGSDPQLASGR